MSNDIRGRVIFCTGERKYWNDPDNKKTAWNFPATLTPEAFEEALENVLRGEGERTLINLHFKYEFGKYVVYMPCQEFKEVCREAFYGNKDIDITVERPGYVGLSNEILIRTLEHPQFSVWLENQAKTGNTALVRKLHAMAADVLKL